MYLNVYVPGLQYEAGLVGFVPVERTIHGYAAPSALRRFSVRNNPVFSCARPMNNTPSSRSNPANRDGRPARAGVIGAIGSRNYGEHGSYLPDRRWRAGLA